VRSSRTGSSAALGGGGGGHRRAYGVQTKLDARVAVHSVAGCFLYGAFVAKIVLVRAPRWRVPGWALPVVGGILVATVAALWYTSALWYFNGLRLPA